MDTWVQICVPLRQPWQRQGGENRLQDFGDVFVPTCQSVRRVNGEGRRVSLRSLINDAYFGSKDAACLVTSASSACKLGTTLG